MTTILLGLLGPCVAFALLERSPRLWLRPLPFLRPRFWTDAFYLLTGFLAGSALTVLYILAVSAALTALGAPRLETLRLSPWVLVPLAVVGLDAGQYFAHWLMHRYDLLWEFHKAHHSSLELDWLATFRSHLGEQTLRRVVGPLPLMLAGVPLEVIALGGAVYGAFAIFNHSNLRLGLGGLDWVLVSPRFHHLHHVPRTTEKNLGTVFTLWDVLRGTAIRAAAPADVAFGLPGDREDYPQDWPRQFLAPPAALFARLRLAIQRPVRSAPPSLG